RGSKWRAGPRQCHRYRANSPRANAEHAPISTGERDGSGSAFAPRIQRRSTGSDYRNRDCPPKYCLCDSSLRTSDTGSPNTHYLWRPRSPRTMGPRKPALAVNQQSRLQEQRWQLESRESPSVPMLDAITTPSGLSVFTADIISRRRHVCFTPESRHVQCTTHVRFGPKADMLWHVVRGAIRISYGSLRRHLHRNIGHG